MIITSFGLHILTFTILIVMAKEIKELKEKIKEIDTDKNTK